MTIADKITPKASVDIRDMTIGIAGFGHLGQSLAVPLVRNSFPKENLRISHGTSETTRRRAESLGFGGQIRDTARLFAESDVIIAAVRPQDALFLPVSFIKRGALVISCMAGLPSDLLRAIFGAEVHRMMCSGPDTILSGKGAAVTYPGDETVKDLLEMMGMRVVDVGFEEELDAFTVGICIPAILLNIDVPEEDVKAGVSRMKERYPVYGFLGDWIESVTEKDIPDRMLRLAGVSTKGGVTEAMTASLSAGASFACALERGMERGREITSDIRRNVTASVRMAGQRASVS
ncbi:MAG: NAD(P)-binding domain-containing protein [Synergistaceae bacterium]|jgi:pyrroline-5-carboxylate reductase|nr:NAD(P)-binding domain-containing protein [Synergistaceae bacterium]